MNRGEMEVTNCPVCDVIYQATGDRAPRLLPCSHTVCEACLKRKVIQRNQLDCPQCAETHSAPDGVESFSINRYILMFLDKVPEKEDREFCGTHNKVKDLFCKEEGCQMAICGLCLKGQHKGHDFGDLEEMKKERCQALLEEVSSVETAIQANKRKLLSTQTEAQENYQNCIDQINNDKKALTEIIDKITEGFIQEIKDTDSRFDSDVNVALNRMNENLVGLQTVTRAASRQEITHKEITEWSSLIEDTRAQLKTCLSKVKTYTCFHYLQENVKHAKFAKRIIGKLESEEKVCVLPKIKSTVKTKKRPKKAEREEQKKTSSSKRRLLKPTSLGQQKENKSKLVESKNSKGSPASKEKVCEPETQEQFSGNQPETPESADQKLKRNNLKESEKPKQTVASKRKSPDFLELEPRNSSSIAENGGQDSTLGKMKSEEVEKDVMPESKKLRVAEDTTPKVEIKDLVSVRTDFNYVRMICPLPDKSIMVCGKKGAAWVLSRYSETNDRGVYRHREIGFGTFAGADGLAVVNLAGKQCLAVSYGFRQRIDFYSVDSLQLVQEHPTAPYHPGRMCTAQAGVLYFVDNSLQIVFWLDCSVNPPQIRGHTSPPSEMSCSGFMRDMCFVDLGEKQLIVQAFEKSVICAFRVDTGQKEWVVGMLGDQVISPVGITTDGYNRLYVCNLRNHAVECFSVQDGSSLGSVRGLGNNRPLRCRWCQQTSSLIVVREDRSNLLLDIMKL